ncbi:erlin-2 [Oenanthe melanoleuca]|uniref:erlin-2 n=1 Tax=Oenanthe melanoleuca TaxID=2939378 RepID=UPI0024C1E6FC|nr:erlin-2 [Oenanthe melanoleuca]
MAQLGAIAALALGVAAAALLSAVHKIDEGHIGVYYRGGALLTSTSGPGFHLMLPFITSYKSVQVLLGPGPGGHTGLCRSRGSRAVTRGCAGPGDPGRSHGAMPVPGIPGGHTGLCRSRGSRAVTRGYAAKMKREEIYETVLDMAKKLRAYADAVHGPTHARIAAVETRLQNLEGTSKTYAPGKKDKQA